MVDILTALENVLSERKQADPDKSYVASLYAGGDKEILAKIEEESGELVDAASSKEIDNIIHETADLWFHCLVLLSYLGIPVTDVLSELENRFGISGIDEKVNRHN